MNVTITPNPNEPLASGDAVTLQCSALDPTGSDLSFQWFKDDHPIPGQSSFALVFDAVEQSDAGTYTCQVSNRLGMKKQMFDLLLNFQGACVIQFNCVCIAVWCSTSCTNFCVVSSLRIIIITRAGRMALINIVYNTTQEYNLALQKSL